MLRQDEIAVSAERSSLIRVVCNNASGDEGDGIKRKQRRILVPPDPEADKFDQTMQVAKNLNANQTSAKRGRPRKRPKDSKGKAIR